VGILAFAAGASQHALALLQAEAGAEPVFQINVFWIITQAASFILFLVILYVAAFGRIGGILEERRTRIEQGLKDADAARQERERAAQERRQALLEARQDAAEIINRAQRAAEELREREAAATRAEMERLHRQATENIEVEKQRALAEIRGEVAELALRAAAKVVGETMNEPRERRLVAEFLAGVGANGRGRDRDTSSSR
jgi:F-type H+-transporting ATPase subunit b